MKDREFTYSWSFKDKNTLYYKTYKNIPELLKEVQYLYDNKKEWFEDNNECVIDLHSIDYFNYENAVEEYVKDFKDIIMDELSTFATGTDCEVEFEVSETFKQRLKEFILSETKDSYFYPQYVGHRLTQSYNLRTKKYENN